jgi:hypothetical protein
MFPRRVVSKITLLIDAVDGVTGLAEIQVLATDAPPPTVTVTATRTPTRTPIVTATPKPTRTATAPGALPTATPQSPTATIGGTPGPTPSPWIATGTVYYLSPGGNDASSGTSPVTPWRTFGKVFNTSRPLKPGDALILLDGTYTRTTTGFPSIDCRASGGNANSGTATQPIIIRAANERQAALVSDGLQAAFYMQDCAWYRVAGLHVKNALNATGTQAGGFPMRLLRVADVWLSRILAHEPNRWQNANPIQIENSQRVLIEEPEVYQFHRHGVSIWQSRFVTVRRGYFNSSHLSTSSAVCGGTPQCKGGGQWGCCSPIDNHEFGDEAISIYGSSDTIVENCISENDANGFQIHGIANALDPSGSGGRRNKIVGSISYGDGVGIFVGSRRKSTSDPTTEFFNARDTVIRDVVVARGRANQIFARQAANVQVTGATLFGSSNAGFAADSSGGWNCQTDAFRCVGSGALCTSNAQCTGTCDPFSGPGCCVRNVEGCSFEARNVLSFGESGAGFQVEGQNVSWKVSSSTSAANAVAFYNPSGFGGYTASIEATTPALQADDLGNIRATSQPLPEGMGLGVNQCLVWVPDASNMKRRGANGTDIGANVLYRYETPMGVAAPVMTSAPLWRSSDGRFVGCGTAVAGINDDPASSCGGVPLRLNINQNGCRFPAGYVGW